MVPTGGSRPTSSKTNQADGRHGRAPTFTHGGPWATGAVLINLAETESVLRPDYRLERHCEAWAAPTPPCFATTHPWSGPIGRPWPCDRAPRGSLLDRKAWRLANNRMNPTKPAMASGTRASRVIRVFDGLLG
jgi:hypothetical protein